MLSMLETDVFFTPLSFVCSIQIYHRINCRLHILESEPSCGWRAALRCSCVPPPQEMYFLLIVGGKKCGPVTPILLNI